MLMATEGIPSIKFADLVTAERVAVSVFSASCWLLSRTAADLSDIMYCDG